MDTNQTPSCDLIERDENAADIITSNFSSAKLFFVPECGIFSGLIHHYKKYGVDQLIIAYMIRQVLTNHLCCLPEPS